MRCQLEGQPIPPEAFNFRELGFGNPITELRLLDYSLYYELAEVCVYLDEDYRVFASEMRADFEATGDTHPDYFHKLGYPPLDQLIHHEEAFGHLIQTYLYSELFRRSFPLNPSDPRVAWIINSIESVHNGGGVIEIRGKAFRKISRL